VFHIFHYRFVLNMLQMRQESRMKNLLRGTNLLR